MAKLSYFKAFTSYQENIKPLSDDEKGRLFSALLEYTETGNVPTLKGNERFVFPGIKAQIDRDVQAYETKCERLSENAMKRYKKTADTDDNVQLHANAGKDKIKEKEKEKEKEKINYISIIDTYHETCVSFPKVTVLSDKRKQAIKARLATYSIEQFQEMFRKAEASDFLKGKNNRDWRANFDWLMKDSNFAKVLDGNYDNSTSCWNSEENNSNSYGNPFLEMLEEERRKAGTYDKR